MKLTDSLFSITCICRILHSDDMKKLYIQSWNRISMGPVQLEGDDDIFVIPDFAGSASRRRSPLNPRNLPLSFRTMLPKPPSSLLQTLGIRCLRKCPRRYQSTAQNVISAFLNNKSNPALH